MADLITQRVMQKIDLNATYHYYMNAITSGVLRSSRLPISLENDRVALETALDLLPDPRLVRMARITNTLKVQTFWATEACLEDLRSRGGVIIDNEPAPLRFDDQGRLKPVRMCESS